VGFESVLVSDFQRRLDRGDRVEKVASQILAIAIALALAGFVVGLICGLTVTQLVAGNAHGATPWDVGIFGLGTGLCIGALLLTPLLITDGHHRMLSFIWVASSAVMCAVMAYGVESIRTAGLGFVLANLTSLIGMGLTVYRSGVHQKPAHTGSD
jgi:hypothetical protein